MRRLSAIMFTDMVGYSAITQKNEALALNLLEVHRTLLRPIFLDFGGREVETAGDLFFVEFDSAVESVACAIEIQETLFKRNALAEEDHKIVLRIGVHIGDVVFIEKRIHGDGVNLAARIQPLARPGGICISEDVARQIRNKIDHPVVSIGFQKLKNISSRMEVYEVVLPWEKPVKARRTAFNKKAVGMIGFVTMLVIIAAGLMYFLSRDTFETPMRLRLAVLPLDNIGANEQDEYFADGMTEELIASLSKIRNLRVIARSSTMMYKNATKSISEICD
jgi:adenylate cyclase